MTIEEAKKFFGENRYRPDLGFLMDEHQHRPAHCKVGEAYWWATNPHFNDPITDRMKRYGKKQKWYRVTCVYRRSGINFIHIDGDVDSFEIPVADGSTFIESLIPETISCKAFKFNPELKFAFKTYGGRIKIID